MQHHLDLAEILSKSFIHSSCNTAHSTNAAAHAQLPTRSSSTASLPGRIQHTDVLAQNRSLWRDQESWCQRSAVMQAPAGRPVESILWHVKALSWPQSNAQGKQQQNSVPTMRQRQRTGSIRYTKQQGHLSRARGFQRERNAKQPQSQLKETEPADGRTNVHMQRVPGNSTAAQRYTQLQAARHGGRAAAISTPPCSEHNLSLIAGMPPCNRGNPNFGTNGDASAKVRVATALSWCLPTIATTVPMRDVCSGALQGACQLSGASSMQSRKNEPQHWRVGK